MGETKEILTHHDFFAGLAENFRHRISDCAKTLSFSPGDYLFHEGDPAAWFYFIRHGRIGLEILLPGRGPLTFQTLSDGDVLGMFWVMPHCRWTYDAYARETSHVLAVEAACLRKKCEEDHELGYDLMKRFVPVLLQQLQNSRLQVLDVYGHP